LVLISVVLLVLSPRLFGLTYRHKSPDQPSFNLYHELVSRDNHAIAISLSGFLMAMGLILRAAMNDFGIDAAGDFGGFAGQTTSAGVSVRTDCIGKACLAIVIGYFGLFTGQFVNRLVFKSRGVDLQDGVLFKSNNACGVIEGCQFICTALTCSGAFSFGYVSLDVGVASTFIIFVVSQLLFIVASLIFQKLTKFDLFKEISANLNVAAALSYSMTMVALANLLHGASSRAFELPTLLVWFALGSVLLALFRLFADKVILPGEDLDKEIREDKNWGAAVVGGAISIGATLIFNNYIADPCVSKSTSFVAGTLESILSGVTYIDSLWHWDRLVSIGILLLIFALLKPAFTWPFTMRRLTAGAQGADGGSAQAVIVTMPTLSDAPEEKADNSEQTGTELVERGDNSKMAADAGGGDNGSEGLLVDAVVMDGAHAVPAGAADSAAWEDILSFDLNHELVKKDNKAVAVAFAGYIFGGSYMLSGVMSSLGDTWSPVLGSQDVDSDAGGAMVYWSLIGVALLMISHFVADHLILPQHLTELALSRGNIATGLTEAGVYVASGTVIGAAVSGGDNMEVWEQFVSTFFWFFVVQVALVVFGWVFNRVTKYDQHKQVREDNASAGLNFAMHMVAEGVLVSKVVLVSQSVLAFVVWMVLGTVLIFVCRFIVDKVILVGESLDKEIETDKNWGAALVSGTVAVVVAMMLNTNLRYCPYVNSVPM
jgi:uncharacterized membrane protein YjfL (UPF0719 family)